MEYAIGIFAVIGFCAAVAAYREYQLKQYNKLVWAEHLKRMQEQGKFN